MPILSTLPTEFPFLFGGTFIEGFCGAIGRSY